jgi:hypothetical protein
METWWVVDAHNGGVEALKKMEPWEGLQTSSRRVASLS